MIKVVEYKAGADEREIVVNMIVNPAVLSAIAACWDDDGLFGSSASNLVARWCVKHHRRNGCPPNRLIENYLDNWCQTQTNDSLIGMVKDLLEAVGDGYDHQGSQSNPQAVIDIANRHFSTIRLRKLAEKMTVAIQRGDTEAAEKAHSEFKPIEIGQQVWTDLFNNEKEFLSTFESGEEEALFEYGGDLQEFLGNTFALGEFVAFLAGPKVGKSWTLADIAWRCMLKRKRVAYFEVGDLGRHRTKKRLITRALAHPWRSTNPDGRWPCRVNIPKDITVVREKGKVPYGKSSTDELMFKSHLVGKEAWAQCKQIVEREVKSSRPYMRISTHPANSLSVSGIRHVMEMWARDGWQCDACVIDYADILAPMPRTGKMDVRDQINQTWIELRRMSQELHCLTVTATQADADGYDRWILDKKNFNGDRRKNDHVTSLLAINQTAEEKERGQCRWSFVNRREAQFSPRQCIFIAQCLAIGQPVVCSSF